MNPLRISYDVKYKDDRTYSQKAEVKIGKNTIITPFLWFGLSVFEDTEFQRSVFAENNIEGIITNAYDLKYQDRNGSRETLVRDLKQENKILIKCDSGGFQNFTRNKQLNQEEVYEIQNRIKSDVAIQLDYPLIPGESEKTNFRRIDKTIANFEKLFELNEKMAILPTIHGYNFEMIEYSIKKISDILGEIPSAVAIGSLVPFFFTMKGTKLMGGKQKALDILRSIREYLPNTFLHVLGVGGTMTYLMLYLGIDSIDNSGWIKKAGFGAIQMPGVSDRFIYPLKGRKSLDDDDEAMSHWLECSCSACRSINTRQEFYGRTKRARYLRSMHNIYVFQTEIWKARKYILEGKIDEFVKKRLRNSTYMKLVNFIDKNTKNE